MKVYIMASCRNEGLYGATAMVFDTLRKGFPSADIEVWVGGYRAAQTYKLCEQVGARTHSARDPHPHWIRDRLTTALTSEEPFYLCDTDLIFWDEVEAVSDWEVPLAGRYIPSFYDEFTRCRTMPRLHTSLLYVNPVPFGSALSAYHGKFPNTVYDPTINLFLPARVPMESGKNIFYDGGALLYQAIGGQRFDESMLNRYDHLHCGCLSDLIEPYLSAGAKMTENNLYLINNPDKARGVWREQDKYFEHFH